MISWHAKDRGCLQSLFPLLLSLVSGAVVGAFSATLFFSGADVSCVSAVFSGFQSVSLFRRILLAFLFPVLLFGASLSGESSLFALLFFGKGILFSCVLCICVNCGFFPERASVYRMLFFRNILPLPVYFFASSILINHKDDFRSGIRFRLLFLVLLTAFVCTGMEAVLSAIL